MFIHAAIIGSTLLLFTILISLVINKRRLQPFHIDIPICLGGATFNRYLNDTMECSKYFKWDKEQFSRNVVTVMTLQFVKARGLVKDLDEAVAMVPDFMKGLEWMHEEGISYMNVSWNESLDFTLEHGMSHIIDLKRSIDDSVPFKFDDYPDESYQVKQMRKRFAEKEELDKLELKDWRDY